MKLNANYIFRLKLLGDNLNTTERTNHMKEAGEN